MAAYFNLTVLGYTSIRTAESTNIKPVPKGESMDDGFKNKGAGIYGIDAYCA